MGNEGSSPTLFLYVFTNRIHLENQNYARPDFYVRYLMGSGVSIDNIDESSVYASNCYIAGEYTEAIIWWTQILASNNALSQKDRINILYNRSKAYYEIGMFKNSTIDAFAAIGLNPLLSKAYILASKSLYKCGRLSESLDYGEKAKALEPNDSNIAKDIDIISEAFNYQQRGQGCTYSWGMASSHLGHKTSSDKTYPTVIDSLRGKHIVDIACGAIHTIAVSGAGEVYAWGDNKYFQTGIDDKDGSGLHPSPSLPSIVPALLGVIISAVSCGAGHTVVVSDMGRAYSWGLGANGQLGLGTNCNVKIPTSIGALHNHCVSAVACGIAHTIFLVNSTSVLFGCGMNQYGCLGFDSQGQPVLSPTCIAIDGMSALRVTPVHVSCGGAHSAVIGSDGSLYTAGSNTCGQLGLNSPEDYFCYFIKVPNFGSSVTASTIRFCAMACCGEEYTIVVTRNHEVWSSGLNIAGQLGDGSFTNKIHFVHIQSLDRNDIEEVACGQGAVFAIAETGEVWTWGKQLFDTATTDTETASLSTPKKAGMFTQRKRARQISCGRKHYALLTVVPYGPSCVVTKSTPPNILEQEESISAGTLLKFEIQSYDIRNNKVSFGGSYVRGFIACLSGASETNESDISLISQSIDVMDNMDGTYSVTCRMTKIGVFEFSLKLDELDISPFPCTITVHPGPISPAHCRFLFNHHTISIPRNSQSVDVGETDAICRYYAKAGETVHIEIELRDKYKNLINEVRDQVYQSLLVASDEKGGSRDFQYVFNIAECITKAFGKLVFPLKIPSQVPPGSVNCTVSFAGYDESIRSKGKGGDRIGSCCFEVLALDIDPSKCTVLYLPRGVVGDDYVVSVTLRDTNANGVDFEPSLMSRIQVVSVLTPHQCQISARALIHLYHNKSPSSPSVGEIAREVGGRRGGGDDGDAAREGNSKSDDGVTPLHIHHVVSCAGCASLKIAINGFDICATDIFFAPSIISARFSEILNPSTALLDWRSDEYLRDVMIQARDKFGNKCNVGGSDIKAYLSFTSSTVSFSSMQGQRAMTVESCPPMAQKTNKCQVNISYEDSGLYLLQLLRPREVSEADTSCELSVFVADAEMLYSPFTLGSIDFMANVNSESDQTKKMQLKMQALKDDNTIMLDTTKLQELTRKRAEEALRKEQQRRREERSAQKLQKSVKRTGGGFIVQYSKDI